MSKQRLNRRDSRSTDYSLQQDCIQNFHYADWRYGDAMSTSKSGYRSNWRIHCARLAGAILLGAGALGSTTAAEADWKVVGTDVGELESIAVDASSVAVTGSGYKLSLKYRQVGPNTLSCVDQMVFDCYGMKSAVSSRSCYPNDDATGNPSLIDKIAEGDGNGKLNFKPMHAGSRSLEVVNLICSNTFDGLVHDWKKAAASIQVANEPRNSAIRSPNSGPSGDALGDFQFYCFNNQKLPTFRLQVACLKNWIGKAVDSKSQGSNPDVQFYLLTADKLLAEVQQHRRSSEAARSDLAKTLADIEQRRRAESAAEDARQVDADRRRTEQREALEQERSRRAAAEEAARRRADADAAARAQAIAQAQLAAQLRQRAIDACRAAAMLAPTRTGRYGESLANAANCENHPDFVVPAPPQNSNSNQIHNVQFCAFTGSGMQLGCYTTMQSCQFTVQNEPGGSCAVR